MAPKGHRSGSTGRLGARSNSATKITSNLQFTQKDLAPSKHSDKQKKAVGHANDKTPLARVNSSNRLPSRDHLQPLKRGVSTQRVNNGKPRAGFTIASKDDEEDEDDWVSSESGAVTPNNHDSDSETASEADATTHAHYTPNQQFDNDKVVNLQRVETARPNEFAPSTLRDESHMQPPAQAVTPILTYQAPTPAVPQLSPAPEIHPTDVNQLQSQLRRMELDSTKETRTDPPSFPQSPRPSSHSTRRSSRPASTYSQSGKPEQLRPHPLIRGQSTGHVNIGRQGSLTPLTAVTGGAAPPQLSTSPASSVHEYLTASPTSTATAPSFVDDPVGFRQDRRSSVSSARSIATLPGQVFPTGNAAFDRARATSLLPSSGSSAALSALTHLPAATRPPSPQAVVFFPPVNPHANIDAIHPLLPGPYLANHLTVLARRNPLRESYDRVVRAKAEVSRQAQ
ncbi:hypothetical protein D9611_000111 [Ephemerocybe angulata]|uniref:Uncharacterized protein n=1 Tax=Ephemerocybe angulata TaxID=980116 RepID=A0A8H5BMU9_9AGAR|nr:hypothetical protein D9611_000111 [Tulosesus angulatus]